VIDAPIAGNGDIGIVLVVKGVPRPKEVLIFLRQFPAFDEPGDRKLVTLCA
jgi:hypothetical protein